MNTANSAMDKRSNFRNNLLWSMYDLANTIFSMGIVSLTVIKFFTLLGMQQGMNWSQANFLAGLAGSISTIIVAITVPFMGALSDKSGERKSKVVLLGSICILTTGLVFIFSNFWIAYFLFIIANITYQWGNLFYDAMIPHICAEDEIGSVSAFGVAVGYVGSFIAIAILFILPLFVDKHTTLSNTGEPLAADGITVISTSDIVLGDFLWMWLICAIAFLITAIPFLWTRERTQKRTISKKQVFNEAFTEIIQTTKEVIRYRDMLMFMIGWILTVDVVNTIIAYMLPAAEDAWGLEGSMPLILIFVGVVGASVLTLGIGPVCDKKGPKIAFLIVGIGYLLALVIAILADTTDPSLGVIWFILLFFVALVIGGAQGSTWVANRQMVIELAPEEKVGQYFGYSKLVSKGGSAIGLSVFAGVLSLTQEATGNIPFSYRVGFVVLGVIYIIGLMFLMLIKDHHKEFLEGKRAPYDK
ncbi:MAG: MFS transporter [Candidatus Hodarchaeota archaeon]